LDEIKESSLDKLINDHFQASRQLSSDSLSAETGQVIAPQWKSTGMVIGQLFQFREKVRRVPGAQKSPKLGVVEQ
jgi:hypothetical protein